MSVSEGCYSSHIKMQYIFTFINVFWQGLPQACWKVCVTTFQSSLRWKMTAARSAVTFPSPNTHTKPSCRTTPWSVLLAHRRSPENTGLFESLKMLQGCWLSCTWIWDCCAANNDDNLDSAISLWKWKMAEWFMIQTLKKNRLWMRGHDHSHLTGTFRSH